MMLEWPEYIQITRLIQDASAADFSEFSGFWHEVGTKRYIDYLSEDMATAAAGLGTPDTELDVPGQPVPVCLHRLVSSRIHQSID